MTASNGHTSDAGAGRPGGSGPPRVPRVQRTAAPASVSPLDNIARSWAAAATRAIRAVLPSEQPSVEARLDALDADITELRTSVRRLGEALAHRHEDAS